jgi:dihydrolipoamide dehydrogenase
VPIDVLRDTIQPVPTFSSIYIDAVHALRREIAAGADATNAAAASSST